MTSLFVGREACLGRLRSALEDALAGSLRLALVSGEAGIGKTSVLSRVAGDARARGGTVVWGTCWDSDSAPAFWPWSQVLQGLAGLEDEAEMPAADRAVLGRLVPGLAERAEVVEADDERDRLRLFDAVVGVLERSGARSPVTIVIDDLQWADSSSLLLLDLVVRSGRLARVLLVGAYRYEELTEEAARLFAALAARTESVRLEGLSPDEVASLVAMAADESTASRWAAEVHRRTGGHPFFARELAHLLAGGAGPDDIPAAVRDAVRGRIAHLSPVCTAVLETAALAGNRLALGVIADAVGLDLVEVAGRAEEAVRAGVLVRDRDQQIRFAHDLFRETIVSSLAPATLLTLHRRLADALIGLSERGGAVMAGDVARHLAAAVPAADAVSVLGWAVAAAGEDRARLAFAEAAAHIRRAREALAAAGSASPDDAMVDALVAEADAIARAGDTAGARTLLAQARERARRLHDRVRLAAVALGVQRLGARFGMPREETVAVLEEAHCALRPADRRLRAQVVAALARELNHSVLAQRARAGPLSEEALALARGLDDPATLVTCLLARHDVLWTPGRAGERAAVAREIVSAAESAGDDEHHCEGLLLTANALLEQGSAGFRPVLGQYLDAAERLGQPRHAYYALTRRAALALLDGHIAEGEALVTESASLGERIGEPDTGNVRMSQLLEVARAAGDPSRLTATAEEAIRWWVGVPSHAHAVAAELHARAGDLGAARRCLDTVLDLDEWRDDRSYLRSIFLGGLAAAAVALADQRLCEELLSELSQIADSCAVNGAVVCYMGCNAHWAGVLSIAVGRVDDGRLFLHQALRVHERLGAAAWEAETCAELASLDAPGSAYTQRAAALAQSLDLDGVRRRLAGVPAPQPEAALVRDGDVWEIRHHTATARLRDAKGLHDLAVLLARPGADVHVLQLAERTVADHTTGSILDSRAREEYRLRLVELEEELARAERDNDIGAAERAEAEREALLAELRRATGLGGRDRGLGVDAVERARKAVSARLRDTIERVGQQLPALGEHLRTCIVTGTFCRYSPRESLRWSVKDRSATTAHGDAQR